MSRSKKFDCEVYIPLSWAEKKRIDAEAERSGLHVTDYRRLSLLSGPSPLLDRLKQNHWEEDTLEDIRSDMKRLLRQQLHAGTVDMQAALALADRLAAMQERRKAD